MSEAEGDLSTDVLEPKTLQQMLILTPVRILQTPAGNFDVSNPA